MDLTERQSRLKYQAILDNASVGIAFTKDQVFQHVNPAFEDMFGWPHGEIAGQPGRLVWGTEAEYQEMGCAVGPKLSQGQPVELLQKLNEELEQRVRERTEELARTNETLQQEVHERLRAEERARPRTWRPRLRRSCATWASRAGWRAESCASRRRSA